MTDSSAVWLRPDDVDRIDLARSNYESHLTVQVRVDRRDDYYTVPLTEEEQDRYVQVGWWNEREGHMMPLYCAGPKSGYTPLYKRQWPLSERGNSAGVKPS